MEAGLVEDNGMVAPFSHVGFTVQSLSPLFTFSPVMTLLQHGEKASLRKWPGHFSSLAVLLQVLPGTRWF